jgi:hypothetical protein
MSLDIRWHQRLANFDLALSKLTDAIDITKQRALTKLEEQDFWETVPINS